jgi:hypothetical protein
MVIPKKEYEKPESGLFHGVLADIVDLGEVTTTYNGQVKKYPAVRFIWILNVNGKDGKPLSVSKRYNVANFHEKSNIYKDLKMILGTAPEQTRDIDTYIGLTRKLWINREKSPDGSKDFANIAGFLPVDPGVMVSIPADFIRTKFRPQQTAGPQGQPVQTYAQPPAQPVQQVQTTTYPQQAPYVQQGPTAGPVPTPQGADVKF